MSFIIPYNIVAKTNEMSISEYIGDMVNVREEWKITKGKGAKVGILDTGVADHPDLNIAGEKSFVYGDEETFDGNGHGTHCAGIVGAQEDNIGVTGIAPECELWNIKVLNGIGFGHPHLIADAIKWCASHDFDILSMSLGIPGDQPELLEACQYANEKGVTIIAAAGNSGYRNKMYAPAVYDSVIAVGATDSKEKHVEWSNASDDIDFATGGVDVWSTYIENGKYCYAQLSGTSMACPVIAGIATLIVAEHRDHGFELSPLSVKAKIEDIAMDIGEKGFDRETGYGLPVFMKKEKPKKGFGAWVKSLFSR